MATLPLLLRAMTAAHDGAGADQYLLSSKVPRSLPPLDCADIEPEIFSPSQVPS